MEPQSCWVSNSPIISSVIHFALSSSSLEPPHNNPTREEAHCFCILGGTKPQDLAGYHLHHLSLSPSVSRCRPSPSRNGTRPSPRNPLLPSKRPRRNAADFTWATTDRRGHPASAAFASFVFPSCAPGTSPHSIFHESHSEHGRCQAQACRRTAFNGG